MSAAATAEAARIRFEVPGGELAFNDGDLDVWAEHLVWCYRLIGIADGGTIAVQDFGTSPLSYLGSSLLMPTLEAGVAERTGAKLICLDASPERVVITPEVIRQVEPDVLVIRADVLGLLLDGSKRVGVNIASIRGLKIIAAIGDEPSPLPPGNFGHILHVESLLLLAPECAHCGNFHLREGFYSYVGGQVQNLRLENTEPRTLPRMHVLEENCEHGPGDLLFKLDEPGSGAPS